MKFEAYQPRIESSERVIRLAMIKYCGDIHLAAVAENGDIMRQGLIMEITEDGRFRRMERVSGDLGFQLDSLGRIEEVE